MGCPASPFNIPSVCAIGGEAVLCRCPCLGLCLQLPTYPSPLPSASRPLSDTQAHAHAHYMHANWHAHMRRQAFDVRANQALARLVGAGLPELYSR